MGQITQTKGSDLLSPVQLRTFSLRRRIDKPSPECHGMILGYKSEAIQLLTWLGISYNIGILWITKRLKTLTLILQPSKKDIIEQPLTKNLIGKIRAIKKKKALFQKVYHYAGKEHKCLLSELKEDYLNY